MAQPWDHLKKGYRARFCQREGKKIDVQPDQNLLKVIQDCFENDDCDLIMGSLPAPQCSTPLVSKEGGTSVQSQRAKSCLTYSMKKSFKSTTSLMSSPLKPVSSRGRSHESPLKPIVCDNTFVSKEKPPVSERKENNALNYFEAVCKNSALQSPSSDSEDEQKSIGSPLLVEDVEGSPLHRLQSDDENSSVVKSHVEVENLEDPQTWRGVQGTEHTTAATSVHKEKPFSSQSKTLAKGRLGERHSAAISPPSPPPMKDQDTEKEDDCEFMIDESDDASFSAWLSIPSKNEKSRKNASVTPVSKSRSSEKEKTETKNRKVQVEALSKQQTGCIDDTAHDLEGTSDPVANTGGKVLKSQRQNSTHTGKPKKGTFRQGSPHLKKDMSRKPEAEELMLAQTGLETAVCEAEELCKTKVMPNKDLPVPSPEHQQECALSPVKSLKSSKSVKSASKASENLFHKKQIAKQKLPKDTVNEKLEVIPRKKVKKSYKQLEESPRKKITESDKKVEEISRKKIMESDKKVAESPRKKVKKPDKKVAESPRKKVKKPDKKVAESLRKEANKSTKKSNNKKPQLQREESSTSESGEEEPVKLHEVFTSPVQQKSETSTSQKFTESEMPEDVLHALESVGDADRVTLVKTLQCIIDSVKKSEKKRSSAKSSEKIPQQRNCKASAGVCSGPEYTEPQMDSDSSSVQDVARKKQKLSHVKNKSNKGKRRGPQNSFGAEEHLGHKSAIVAERCDKFASRSKSCEQDNSSSDSSEDLNSQLKASSISGHKIVMPSNTPNVRRTKRIRMRPLEYWRGERVNYAMSPSGSLVINGIVCPETETPKRMKGGHKQKRVEISSDLPASLGHVLADASKPTVVVDPETNEEVLLDCVNTDNSNTCFFKDETIEIYKNLNTSTFSTGRLILKPLKEKTHQFVHMDTIVFHVIRGRIIVTLHKTSYYLTTGDFFYVPPGNGYSIHNLVNKECVLLFTQLKDDR